MTLDTLADEMFFNKRIKQLNREGIFIACGSKDNHSPGKVRIYKDDKTQEIFIAPEAYAPQEKNGANNLYVQCGMSLDAELYEIWHDVRKMKPPASWPRSSGIRNHRYDEPLNQTVTVSAIDGWTYSIFYQTPLSPETVDAFSTKGMFLAISTKRMDKYNRIVGDAKRKHERMLFKNDLGFPLNLIFRVGWAYDDCKSMFTHYVLGKKL